MRNAETRHLLAKENGPQTTLSKNMLPPACTKHASRIQPACMHQASIKQHASTSTKLAPTSTEFETSTHATSVFHASACSEHVPDIPQASSMRQACDKNATSMHQACTK
jgi:hypothetical protein